LEVGRSTRLAALAIGAALDRAHQRLHALHLILLHSQSHPGFNRIGGRCRCIVVTLLTGLNALGQILSHRMSVGMGASRSHETSAHRKDGLLAGGGNALRAQELA
jgi:hypothetical protein